MRIDIEKKISKLLKTPISKESEVVYLMAEIRKLIDLKKKELGEEKSRHYSRISFYSDWCVHVELDRYYAKKQLNDIALLTKVGEIDNKIFEFLKFKELKIELVNFFKEHEIESVAFFKNWKKFERSLINVLSDCPLLISKPSLGQIKKFNFNKIIGNGKYISCVVEYEKAKDGSGYSASIGILE